MSTNDTRVSRPRDIAAFLANYPGISKSDPKNDPSANYLFYLNRLRCQPVNLLIDDIHSKWCADYDKLEGNHAYIQWLFPIQEDGVNADAYRLLPHEIGMMRNSEEIICRLVTSYKMMLGFYGMRLISESGLLGRALPPRDFKLRYRNLLGEWVNMKSVFYWFDMVSPDWPGKTHNNLRITRILECLSELGMEHLNAGFILHVLNEQSENGMLDSATLRTGGGPTVYGTIMNETGLAIRLQKLDLGDRSRGRCMRSRWGLGTQPGDSPLIWRFRF